MAKKISALALAVASVVSGGAFADTQDEVNKQVAKLIGDAVSSRVSSSVAAEQQGLKAPNNVWASYSRLYIDPKNTNRIGTDISVVGYDRDLSKDWTIGVAASYAHTNEFNSRSWDISPYIAYRFTDSIFAVARANYNDFGSPGTTGDGLGGSLSINGIHNFGNLYAKWRGEFGSNEAESRAAGRTTDSSSTTRIGDGEIGYRFGYGLSAYAGLQASETNRKDSYATYARLGLEKEIGKDAAVSVKYETKVDDNLPSRSEYRVEVFTIAARFRF